jgi:MazG family protein
MFYIWAWPADELEIIPYEAARRMRTLDFILLGEQRPAWLRELPASVRVRAEPRLNYLPALPAEVEALAQAVRADLEAESGKGLLILPGTVLPQGRVVTALTDALADSGWNCGGFWTYRPGPSLAALAALTAELRAPWGCPWDKEQTHLTLRKHLIEEAYEAVEAIEEGDMLHLCEELGDVLFQIIFHMQIAVEKNLLSWPDLLDRLQAKMIRRHPHIFGAARAETSGDVTRTWEAVKEREKAARSPAEPENCFDLPSGLPALMLAEKTQQRAEKRGWFAGRPEELAVEIRMKLAAAEQAARTKESVTEKAGDLIFAVVKLCRSLDVHGEEALRAVTRLFQAGILSEIGTETTGR